MKIEVGWRRRSCGKAEEDDCGMKEVEVVKQEEGKEESGSLWRWLQVLPRHRRRSPRHRHATRLGLSLGGDSEVERRSDDAAANIVVAVFVGAVDETEAAGMRRER